MSFNSGPTRNIYYFCLDTETPYGSLKKIYQHVDVLNSMGLKAYVVHIRAGFRFKWFQNQTPIVYVSDPSEPLTHINQEGDKEFFPPFSREDILVVMDTMAYKIMPSLPDLGLYAVIFNQNAYLTFSTISFPHFPFMLDDTKRLKKAYINDNLLGTIIVSDENAEYLTAAFGEIDLYRIHNTLDFNIFHYTNQKKKLIAFMPRIMADSRQVVQILKARDNLRNWTFMAIDKMTEQEVSEALGESAFFLSFSIQKGCPLAPQEAMLRGCTVIGYHGEGGKEYIHEPYAYPISPGEIAHFAKTVEKHALEYENHPEYYLERAKAASDMIKSRYSPECEKNDLYKAWKAILKKHAKALESYA